MHLTLNFEPDSTMTSMHKDTLLEIRNLYVKFGTMAAVQDFNLTLKAGETHALVGESGSGKSVTAMAILRLIEMGTQGEITSGEVLFRCPDGQVIDLLKQTEAQMRSIRGNQISMIFQEPLTSLNPVLTIGDQIAEPLILHQQMSRQQAREESLNLLQQMRISEAEKRLSEYPHQLSGGMRQRVMIAMAMACRPQILIADEPTTALDVTIQAQVLELIKELKNKYNTAVLMITHDMGVVAEVADQVSVMHLSKLVETGDVHQIFNRPQESYTQALLSSVPKLGATADFDLPKMFELAGQPIVGNIKPKKRPDYQATPVLQIQNLVKYFPVRQGRVHALEKVSLDLAPGETLAIVGESGCGKSTLGNLCCRLLDSDQGSIHLDGIDISHLNQSQLRPHRKHIQMIFQDPYASLDPQRRVGDSVAEPLVIEGKLRPHEIKQRVSELFVRVGLDAEQMERYPHQFSGGQRQRICIARALTLNPKVVVADESVSALDVSVQAQVINLMIELQQDLGLSYLFISHDMAVVERVSHRVAVMYLGQIVEIGSRQAIFNSPQHSYTKKLLSAVPISDPSRRTVDRALIEGEVPSPIHNLDYTPIHLQFRQVKDSHYVAIED